MLIDRVVCSGPSCLEVIHLRKGGRPREYCSEACRKAAARRGVKDTRRDKVLLLTGRMQDRRARIHDLLEDNSRDLDTLWLVMDTVGEG